MFSIKSMKCKKCSNHFKGFVLGSLNVMSEYTAACPACGDILSVYGSGEFIDKAIPANAIMLKSA